MEQTEKQSAESLYKLLKATPMMLANDKVEVNVFSNKISVKDNVKNITKHYNVLKEEFDEEINGLFVFSKDANNIKYFIQFVVGPNNEKYFHLKLYQGESLLTEKVKLVNLLK